MANNQAVEGYVGLVGRKNKQKRKGKRTREKEKETPRTGKSGSHQTDEEAAGKQNTQNERKV